MKFKMNRLFSQLTTAFSLVTAFALFEQGWAVNCSCSSYQNPDTGDVAEFGDCGSCGNVAVQPGPKCICCASGRFNGSSNEGGCGCDRSTCTQACYATNICAGNKAVSFACVQVYDGNANNEDTGPSCAGFACPNTWSCTPAVAPTSSSTNMVSTTFVAIRENAGISVSAQTAALGTYLGLGIASFSQPNDSARLIASSKFEGSSQSEDSNQGLPSGSPIFFAKGKERNAIWGKGIYQNIKEGSVSFNSWGAFVGYDSLYTESLIGVVAGYFHSQSNNTFLGGGSVDFASLTLHGMVEMPHSTYFQWGLLGSFNWNELDRNEAPNVLESSFLSYTVAPSLSFGYDRPIGSWFILEPYVSTDFIFDFEPSYEEVGTSFLRRKYNSHESGVFRLETGFNLYEHWKTERTLFLLREKVGYVRRQVMFGATSTFGLDALQDDIVEADSGLYSQNLLTYSAQFFVRFYQGVFFSLHYRGEQGWSPERLVLNEGRARIGYYF